MRGLETDAAWDDEAERQKREHFYRQEEALGQALARLAATADGQTACLDRLRRGNILTPIGCDPASVALHNEAARLVTRLARENPQTCLALLGRLLEEEDHWP